MELEHYGWQVLGFGGFSGLSSSPTPRPGLTLVAAQAHGKDQHPATPSALHAVPKLVLSGWLLSCAAPRLRNLGWVGSSENPHLRRAITTPLSSGLDYKIITSLQVEGGTRARQVVPGSQNQPGTCYSALTSPLLAEKGGHSRGVLGLSPIATFCALQRVDHHHPLPERSVGQVPKTSKLRTSEFTV